MITQPPSIVAHSIDPLFDGKTGRVIFLKGGNFSGRSDIIQALIQKAAIRGEQGISIPPEVHSALSGLAPNVEEELLLHLGKPDPASPYWCLAEEWGLLTLRDREPLSLSGGQQALLAILCKLALRPRVLALDGALEQLDTTNAKRVLAALWSEHLFADPCLVVISHNGSWPEDAQCPRTVEASQISTSNDHTLPPALDPTIFRPAELRNPPTIEVRDAMFRYPGGQPVFTELNLILYPGRIYRLAGRNGAGKSTFARLLCGILRLTSGSININGQSTDLYKRPGSLARLHFQNPDAQLFEHTVYDEFSSLPESQREPAVLFPGLSDLVGCHPFDLPFVLRKRLALSLILHTTAPWLIFDEPTLGLDSHSQTVIIACLVQLAKHGAGVILISHNSELVRAMPTHQEISLHP